MHIMVMNLGSPSREKVQHISTLSKLMQADESIDLTLLCSDGSGLHKFAENNGMQALLVREGASSKGMLRFKLFWRLRNRSIPWVLLCFDQPSFALALRLARKRDHLKVVYAALKPEAMDIKKLPEKIHLVSAVIANTSEIAESLKPEGFLASRLHTLHSCIDSSLYLPRRREQGGKVCFACSDSLEEGKGYEQLFKALNALYKNSAMPAWEVRIAAGGPLFEPLLEQARELGVDGRIAIFGCEHGADILQDCDILIAPASAPQGSSLSIKEGWASGLPVLCSDIPAHRELVTDGENGLLFRNDDPVNLAAQMAVLAQDAALQQRLVSGGYASLPQYDCKAVLKKYLEVFEQILGEDTPIENAEI